MLTNMNSQDSVNVPTRVSATNAPDNFTTAPYTIKNRKSGPEDLAEALPGNVNVDATILILDEFGSIRYITDKFVLNGFQMSMKEKFQLLESFGSANISFFGESARVYSFSGMAVDYASSDPNNTGKYFHQSSLIKMYNDVLRGTQLVQNRRIAIMKVMNHLIYGYPINMNVGYSGAGDNVAQFGLQWVVTSHTLSLPGIVEENDLANMYSPIIRGLESKEKQTFIQNSTEVITKISQINTIFGQLSNPGSGKNYGNSGYLSDLQDRINELADVVANFIGYSEILGTDEILDGARLDVSKYNEKPEITQQVNEYILRLNKLKNDLIIFKSYRML